jgi:5-methylcytosine-specific restriction endonuclease McrA
VPFKRRSDYQRWRKSYQESLNRNERRYYQRHKKEINERARLRRLKNPKRNYAGVKSWRARNPDKARRQARVYVGKRRARKQTNGPFERIDPSEVFNRDGGRCGICGEQVDPTEFEVDHIVPISRGGTHELSNVQLAHRTCNRKKWNKLPPP